MCKIPILFELLKSKNVTQYKLGKDLEISQGNISTWKNGKSAPTMDKLTAIADYFNVSVDYLLGREKPSVPPENFTSQEQELIEKYRHSTIEKQHKILDILFK